MMLLAGRSAMARYRHGVKRKFAVTAAHTAGKPAFSAGRPHPWKELEALALVPPVAPAGVLAVHASEGSIFLFCRATRARILTESLLSDLQQKTPLQALGAIDRGQTHQTGVSRCVGEQQ
jgi:hypothetical protein